MKRLASLVLIFGGCSASETSTPRKVTVLFFITTDCPIANSYAPEIIRIVNTYGPSGVVFERIYTDLTLTPEAIRRHSEVFGYDAEEVWTPSPGRIDAGHVLSRRYGVTVT